MATVADVLDNKPLPANLDAERYILGAILADGSQYIEIASQLSADDLSVDKHRRIWDAMAALYESSERIDRVTVANAMMRGGKLEAIGGLGYLVSLDEGLPQLYNLPSYVRIVKEKARARTVARIASDALSRILVGEADPDDVAGQVTQQLMTLQDRSNESSLISADQFMESTSLDELFSSAGAGSGVPTGFRKFDEETTGLQPGELIIIAARPAMGKTAFALNIGSYAATRQNKVVAIFSLEMSKEALHRRMLCSAARVDAQRARRNMLNRDERDRLRRADSELRSAPIYYDDASSATALEMQAKLRRLKRTRGLDLVIIDYLQLMMPHGRPNNRNEELGMITRMLKLTAKELVVPIVLLSQLSRAPEQRGSDMRPRLSDLRESGNIEQDADVVGFLFREEYYKRDREDLRGLAELILAKQRNGPTSTVNLIWLSQFTRFENRSEDTQAEAPPEQTGRRMDLE